MQEQSPRLFKENNKLHIWQCKVHNGNTKNTRYAKKKKKKRKKTWPISTGVGVGGRERARNDKDNELRQRGNIN